jgi:hypothetical protein
VVYIYIACPNRKKDPNVVVGEDLMLSYAIEICIANLHESMSKLIKNLLLIDRNHGHDQQFSNSIGMQHYFIYNLYINKKNIILFRENFKESPELSSFLKYPP